MNRALVYCCLCGTEVDPRSVDSFREVHGWVAAKGAKNFRTEGYGDEWCHRACLDLHRAGRDGQQAMAVG